MKNMLNFEFVTRALCYFVMMCFLGGVVPLYGTCGINSAINIVVHELLPEGVAGVKRNDETLTFGIPLKASDGIRSTSELGLVGASNYQFRELHRYPDGSIQWVLVDTLVSVEAGGNKTIWLTSGSGNSAGSHLAVDGPDHITVNTGAARFVIRKKNYNVFDSVIVDGSPYLKETGGITAISGATRYSSALDDDSTAVIEENGPVKAVVRCDGHLKPESGPWLFGYTMRMYFYKDSGRTRLDLIIKNAEMASYSVKIFESLRIELPTTASVPSYFFSTGPGTESHGAIDGTAYLYQGYSSHKYVQYLGGASMLRQRLAPDTGLKVVNGDSLIHALGDETDHSEGFGAMYSVGKQINVGIRNLHGMWPAGFTMEADGDLFIDIFSPWNTKDDIGFAFFAHDKRQVVLEFTKKEDAPLPQQTFYAMQYPLAGRASFNHYKDSGAVYYENRLATHEETRKFLAEIGLDNYEISNVDSIRRYYHWGQAGGDNQYDLNLCQYLHYLQTGNGGVFLAAQNMDHYKMFGSTRHSDDFDFYVDGPELFPNVNTVMPPHQEELSFNYKPFDREHSHDISVPIGYFLTGDESFKEAWKSHGEYTLYDQGSGKGAVGSYYDGTTYVGYPRIFSRALRRAGAFGLYASTDVWREKITRIVRNFMSMRATPLDVDKNGWDLDRGFFYMSKAGNCPEGLRCNKVFMSYDIFPNSFWVYGPDNFDDDLMYEDYRDYLLGEAYHCLTEIIPLEHQVYMLALDSANESDETGEYPFSFLMALGYEMTGDDAFLVQYKSHYKMMLVTQSEERVYSPYSSKFIHDYYNRDIVAGYVNPVGNGRVDMGNSSAASVSRHGSVYTLTWNAPLDGIHGYQLKVAPVPMVENLNFDQVARSYQYHPDLYDNYWAALNVANEPMPKQKRGDVESVSVDVTQVISAYNARYDLSEGDPAYRSYDPSIDYYFAVKYSKVAPVAHEKTISSVPCP
ncbi:exo-rhamnogalacturonan lyase family protein [Desulfoluna spongiiphila]|uniref:exo-rhamnogalacturonan lyase family protein n=1 Tax=Desulfoluna spongiiphila TaxID=419481 RepID=UPI0012542544|nr:hypothetical protein [Desulfoluna spongiiphila]VVS94012.1 hypothetical protein DBB_35840 [Desulfoluna spongiiphila]